jgi:hypothetical protein
MLKYVFHLMQRYLCNDFEIISIWPYMNALSFMKTSFLTNFNL